MRCAVRAATEVAVTLRAVAVSMLAYMETYDAADLVVPETRRWLTAVLRPAGLLDQSGLDRVGLALAVLATCSDMVVIDLTAATVTSSRDLAQILVAPAVELDQAGRCLLLRGVPARVRAELDRAAVPVITLADDGLPV
ncbi:MAG: hypothetical protein JWM19_7233 [Actinomycetia bacterium]|nr:hypothetical protein [Actinomycetes bacterium]